MSLTKRNNSDNMERARVADLLSPLMKEWKKFKAGSRGQARWGILVSRERNAGVRS